MAIPLSVRRSIGISSLRNMVHRMIEDLYRARTPGSAALYARASRVLPAGLTHDSRATSPYPIYAARAAGARKWDVDRNEYVDYFGGHGALLFGHAHAPLVEALQRQATLGTHWGASHELEVQWAGRGRGPGPSAPPGALPPPGPQPPRPPPRPPRRAPAK